MRSFRSPFQSLKQEPVPVVPLPNNRYVWFISTGAIDGNISPISLQEKKRKQAMLTALILDAAQNLAKELGISTNEARRLMSGGSGDRAKYWAKLSEPKRQHYISTLEAMHDDGLLTKAELKEQLNFDRAEVVYDPLDYLDKDEKQAYFELASESEETPFLVASLMMRYRLAYELTLSEPAKAKAVQLYVYEPWFAVEVGDLFKFDNFSVQVTAPYDEESGSIQVTAIAGKLEAGATGFLLKSDRSYVMGDPKWTDEKTKGLSVARSDDQPSDIEAIYSFYRKEAREVVDQAEDAELEGKSQTTESKKKALMPTSNQSLLTGGDSTGKSNPTESEMNGSTPKTLEVSLTG